MLSLACLNGEILPVEEARVPVWDRGFTFADSIYEVFRIYGGRLWLEAEHFARLERSLREMEYPEIDFARLRHRIIRTIEMSRIEAGSAYIQITRGVAPRAHAFPKPAVEPTEVIIVRAYDDAATEALRDSGVSTITQPDLRWGRCDVKSTNLLANVVALEHAHRAGAYEAILIDKAGLVTEATHSSLLWVRSGNLFGTPEGFEILPGTKRHFIERIASDAGIAFSVARIPMEELLVCDEVILTGTTIEVLAVTSIDDRPIGDRTPGPVARRLRSAYRAAVQDWLRVS